MSGSSDGKDQAEWTGHTKVLLNLSYLGGRNCMCLNLVD